MCTDYFHYTVQLLRLENYSENSQSKMPKLKFTILVTKYHVNILNIIS